MKIVWSLAIIAGVIIMLCNYDAKLAVSITGPQYNYTYYKYIYYAKLKKLKTWLNKFWGAYSSS